MSEESGSVTTSSTTSPGEEPVVHDVVLGENNNDSNNVADVLSSLTKESELILADNNNTKTSDDPTLGGLASSTLDESPTTAPDLHTDFSHTPNTDTDTDFTPLTPHHSTPSNGPKTPHKSVRVHKSEDRIISEAHLLNQLQKLCRIIDLELGEISYEKYLPAALASRVSERVHEGLGFSLEVRSSGMDGGGNGVFVSHGRVPAKHLVAIYPGTVYKAGDTILIQSLANPYVFQCADGSLVDGSSRSLSRMIYNSCSFRDRYGSLLMSDLTWLNPAKANPLALGQIVNNHSLGMKVDGSSRSLSRMIYNSCSFRDRYGSLLMSDLTCLNPAKANPLALGQIVNNHSLERPANVAYQEADLPLAHFLPNLRRYLPNCLYNSTILGEDEENPVMRVVLLCSLRDIEAGEELLSSYFTLIT